MSEWWFWIWAIGWVLWWAWSGFSGPHFKGTESEKGQKALVVALLGFGWPVFAPFALAWDLREWLDKRKKEGHKTSNEEAA